MKYEVTHKCGHTATHELFGKNSERERRIAYLESIICADCCAEEQAKKTGGTWVEMPYGEYKTKYASCPKRNYNPETKTILVLVPSSSKSDDEMVAEIEALGAPKAQAIEFVRMGSNAMADKLAALYRVCPNPDGRNKSAAEVLEKIVELLRANGR